MAKDSIPTIQSTNGKFVLGPLGLVFTSGISQKALEKYYAQVLRPMFNVRPGRPLRNLPKITFFAPGLSKSEIRKFLELVECEYDVVHEIPVNESKNIVPLLECEDFLVRKGQNRWLWVGESDEGPFLGPLLGIGQSHRHIHMAFQKWSKHQKLVDLGIPVKRPPCAFTYLVKNYPHHAWAALKKALQHPEDSIMALTLHSRKIWTDANVGKHEMEDLRKNFIWERGLFRAPFKSKRCRNVFIERMQAPIMRNVYLEGNSGKGESRRQAKDKCFYESIERYSAYMANQCAHKGGIRAFRLGTNKTARVKIEQVAFPLKRPIVGKLATTSGLAFHRIDYKAQLKSIEEVLEKDNLYRHFLHQRRPYGLPRRYFPRGTKPAGRPYYIVYPDQDQLPIVHCFLYFSQGFISRGSGSGNDLRQAAKAAYLEAVQLGQNFGNPNVALSRPFVDWKDPQIIRKILRYFEGITELPARAIRSFKSDRAKYEYLVDHVSIYRDIRLVQLPSLVRDGVTYRAIISGTLTHQNQENFKFKHGVPA